MFNVRSSNLGSYKRSRALRVCQNRMESSMLNNKLQDKIKLTNIRSETKVEDVTYTVKKLNWVGHTISKKKKWTKEVIVWCPRDGKRRKSKNQMGR
ncbi:hypothetical protein EVAR_6825_1 [Eumeta japonica]|uniref:Uncharacterized protein n=1 Tax=Eumeta variegata TaxID=151549 RepID=A0A4C1U657_EUMVA|nr:hypothetical protein EVAR_6825_1 [Eumeta japonica]